MTLKRDFLLFTLSILPSWYNLVLFCRLTTLHNYKWENFVEYKNFFLDKIKALFFYFIKFNEDKLILSKVYTKNCAISSLVMSWSRDSITWSHLLSSNDILLSPHPLTTLSLLTSHLILLSWNIALMRCAPARIISRFLQPSSHYNSNLTLSTSETIRELDYLTKPCNWGRHTKQNQPRMMLVRRT